MFIVLRFKLTSVLQFLLSLCGESEMGGEGGRISGKESGGGQVDAVAAV